MSIVDLFHAVRQALHPSPDLVSIRHPNGRDLLTQVPKDYTLKTQEGPKGQAPAHQLSDLRDFAAYLHARADAGPTDVVVNAGGATALFDPASMTAAVITCELVKHPYWLMWMGLLGRPMDTETFHDAVRAIEETLPATAEDQPSQAGQLLRALLELQIVSTGECKVEFDPRGAVTYKGSAEKTTVSGSIPTRLTVRLPMYQDVLLVGGGDTEDREAIYDLPVLVTMKIKKGEKGGHEAIWILKAATLPLVEAAALRDVVAYLRHLLGEEWLVSVGRPSTREIALPLPAPAPELPPAA